MVLAYIPETLNEPEYAFKLPKSFDDGIYLLERQVSKRLAIIETNKCLVDKVDFIVAGVITHEGEAPMLLANMLIKGKSSNYRIRKM